jgi:choline kinase
MDRLVAHDGDALLVDVGTRFTDEQYMTGIAAGRVAALRRGPADGFDDQGEWVGFARLRAARAAALREGVARRIAAGATAGGYEDELAALCVAAGDVTVVPTDGLPWVEIDFPADLERARALFSTAAR